LLDYLNCFQFRTCALESTDSRLKEELGQLEKMILEVERFSAIRFFLVDRSTLLGLTSAIVTFLVIMLQEKQPRM
jgi:7tm Chemosensory receptor